MTSQTTALLAAAEGLTTDHAARAAWTLLGPTTHPEVGPLLTAHGPVGALAVLLDDAHTDLPIHELLRTHARRTLTTRSLVAALRAAERTQAHLLTPDATDWPTTLNDLAERAPIALWIRGDATALAEAPITTITGARAATPDGTARATNLARTLARRGHTIAAGGAYGIEGAAHQAALETEGKSIAALAGGVDRLYPTGHDELLTRIANTGAVFSEAACGTPPTRARFDARTRLLAALAGWTIVVESGARSGSLTTAMHATGLGRRVGAFRTDEQLPGNAGGLQLLADGVAVAIDSAADLAA